MSDTQTEQTNKNYRIKAHLVTVREIEVVVRATSPEDAEEHVRELPSQTWDGIEEEEDVKIDEIEPTHDDHEEITDKADRVEPFPSDVDDDE